MMKWLNAILTQKKLLLCTDNLESRREEDFTAIPSKKRGKASLFLCCAKATLLLAPKGGEPRSPPLESPIAICSAGIAGCLSAIPAKKRGNSFLVFMLRKSHAFACTKRGRTAISPFGIPHRDMFGRNR